MKTLSKEAEKQVIDAIADICDRVSDGMTPTDAVIKVARDRDFNRNFVKLAIAGYNTGATTYQRQTGKTILEKLAEFPLAWEEKVMEALFPSSVLSPVAEKNASTVSSAYSQLPIKPRAYVTASRVKAASAKLDYPDVEKTESAGDSKIAMQMAYGKSEKERNELAALRMKYAAAQERFVSVLGQFADYFKQSAYDREWSFSDVDAIAAQRYGTPGTTILDYVQTRNRTKDARSKQIKTARAVDWQQKPFSQLAACVKAAEEVVTLRRAFTEKQANTEARIGDILRPFAHNDEKSTNGGTTSTTKESSIMGGLTFNLTRPIAERIIPPVGAAQNRAQQAVTDPYVDQEFQAIRARAMLQDLLSNDEVISGYDPEQVVEGYNELAAISPNAAVQIAMMRPMLRKWLTQHGMEPFEVQELGKMETTMQENRGLSSPQITAVGGSDKGNGNDLQRTKSILA